MKKFTFSPMLLRFWQQRYEDGETLREIADSCSDYGFDLDPETLRTKLIEFGVKMRPKSRRRKTLVDIILS